MEVQLQLILRRERLIKMVVLGSILTSDLSFDYNGESNLDLEYGMTLVTKGQNVTLYQVGDAVEGMETTSMSNIQG
jgi:tripeptidyl-peptidase-1